MTRRALLLTALPAALHATLPERPNLLEMARRTHLKINEIRALRNLPPLEWSDSLALLARQHCARKEKLHFPGHNDPQQGDVGDRLGKAGIAFDRCGENIFEIRGYDDPVNFALVFWWYMLNPAWLKTGVGVSVDETDRFYVTQIFLAPAPPNRLMLRSR
jgi:uncharacterized protein YkwD